MKRDINSREIKDKTDDEVKKEKSAFVSFLARKDVVISIKRYGQDALSGMALGLFASLIVGLIISTLGEQLVNVFGDKAYLTFLIDSGNLAKELTGAAIGAGVAWGVKAPPLVLFSAVITSSMGYTLGGPAGAFIAALFSVEVGKLISKETKIDIIITPAVTILSGSLISVLVGPGVQKLMEGLGGIISAATQMQPLLLGIVVSVIVGLALTGPISSAALCIMLNLSGLAAGAATAGCCAQMVGFAVIGFRENGWGGVFAQGIGSSKIQMPNVVKNPWILLPATLTSVITGALATCVFMMTNNAMGAGMGTSGLVGQICTLTDMGFTLEVVLKILLLHIIIPIVLAIIFDRIFKKLGKIKVGDYKLDL